jgi:hypothetical protein
MYRDGFMEKNYTDHHTKKEEQQDQHDPVVNNDENFKTETNSDVKQESEFSPIESQSGETEAGEGLSAILPLQETNNVEHKDDDQ